MRQHIKQLYDLQQIDLTVRELEQRLKTLPQRQEQLEEEAAGLHEKIAGLEQEREALTKEVKTLEGTIEAENHRVRQWEKRLKEIRNQREFLALNREIEGARRSVRNAEEKILEFNIQKEGLDKELDGFKDAVAEKEMDASAERDKVAADLEQTQNEIAAKKAAREKLLPELPKALARKYENIREKRMGIALVPVEEGSCQGCNMKIPPQLYNELQRGEKIEQCPSCQRLIYWAGLVTPSADESGEPTIETQEGDEDNSPEAHA